MIPTFSWGLAAKLGAIVGLVAALWWAQARIRVSYEAEAQRDAAIANLSSYRTAVETAARVAAAQLATDQKADALLASRLAALQTDNEALRRAASRIPSTVEKPDANGVPRLAISPAWGVCLFAQAGRNPADVAACKAGAGDERLPDPISQ